MLSEGPGQGGGLLQVLCCPEGTLSRRAVTGAGTLRQRGRAPWVWASHWSEGSFARSRPLLAQWAPTSMHEAGGNVPNAFGKALSTPPWALTPARPQALGRLASCTGQLMQ